MYLRDEINLEIAAMVDQKMLHNKVLKNISVFGGEPQ